jgi:LmeA-like phospholipid-binding
MSSDPTRPNPEWWNSQDPQAPQRNQGYQAGQGYQANQGYQDSQPTQRLPVNQGYQASQDYAGPGPRIRRRRRRKWPWISLLAIIVILIAADRVGVVIAQNKMASQIQQQGFPTKPDVTIQGFPFLTQLAARDFKTVVISASNVTEGPLEIASLNATIHGMHINSSFSGATVDSINGSALITFAALAHAGGIPQGVMLSADGPNQIKATLNTPLGDLSVVAQVTKTGPNAINVKVTQFGDVPPSLLGNLANFTVNVPKSALPAGLTVQSVSVTQQGVLITIVGHNTTLSQ